MKPERIKNILVVRNDRFGEFLLNIPAFRALKETFSGARLVAVVHPYVAQLAGYIPDIDEVIAWGGQAYSLTDRLRLVGVLRKKKIDLAVMLNPSKEFNWMSFAAGIPVRLGYDRKSGFLLTHKIRDEKYLGDAHEIDYNLRLVAQVAAKTADKTLGPLLIDEGLITETLEIGSGDFVALHPFTSDPVKQWPLGNFRALALKLRAEYKMNLAIVGGPEETARSAEYFSGLDARTVNLTGETSLPQLAAVLKKARLLISGDSGPVHLACCMGTPVVAIFRNDIPGKGPVRWGPVSKGSLVIAKNNLADISTDEVCVKVEEVLHTQ